MQRGAHLQVRKLCRVGRQRPWSAGRNSGKPAALQGHSQEGHWVLPHRVSLRLRHLDPESQSLPGPLPAAVVKAVSRPFP